MKMHKPRLILLLFLNLLWCVIFCGSSFAQSLRVTGKVVDIRNQNVGVAGIRVVVFRDRIPIGRSSQPSDSRGIYSVEFPAGGPIEVAYGNSQWVCGPVTLPGNVNHSIDRVLVKI